MTSAHDVANREPRPPSAPTPAHFLELTPGQRAAWLADHGQPHYRADQIQRWLFHGRVDSFEKMTDLPKSLRADLACEFKIMTTRVVTHHRAADHTEKLLLQLADGNTIECVLIRENRRRTICISTQVGCAMGCDFCASGIGGVVRSLTTGEILEQILQLLQRCDEHERLSHIVVMGMGEPLANLDALLPALDVARSEAGLGISARRITISTVGLPPAIRRLADEGRAYHLAVSLHAPDDALRNQLVRVNQSIGIDAILEAADVYFASNRRRLTFEYVLLADVNDQPSHAHALAERLAGRTALVNLIPFNPVSGLPYRTPSDRAVDGFVATLQRAGISTQIRRRKGDEIDAACGQLRRLVESAPET